MPEPDLLEPADDAEAPAEGNLAALTDEAWRDAHKQLEELFASEQGEVPDLAYVWAPDRKAEALAELEGRQQ